MQRMQHSSRELAPCWYHLQKWDDGRRREKRSPTPTRQPGLWVLKEFHEAALANCAQYGWCTPYGFYLHLLACASEQAGKFGSFTLNPQLFSEHFKALERAQERIWWSIRDFIHPGLHRGWPGAWSGLIRRRRLRRRSCRTSSWKGEWTGGKRTGQHVTYPGFWEARS